MFNKCCNENNNLQTVAYANMNNGFCKIFVFSVINFRCYLWYLLIKFFLWVVFEIKVSVFGVVQGRGNVYHLLSFGHVKAFPCVKHYNYDDPFMTCEHKFFSLSAWSEMKWFVPIEYPPHCRVECKNFALSGPKNVRLCNLYRLTLCLRILGNRVFRCPV